YFCARDYYGSNFD
nr:immunoglobulin heavy chain junction region [Mus musculus]